MDCSRFISTCLVGVVVLLVTACSDMSHDPSVSDIENYLENNEHRSALLIAKQLVKDAPEKSEYRHLLAKIYFQMGDFSNALLEWDKGDEFGGANSSNSSERVFSYLRTGQFETLIATDESLYHEDALLDLKAAKIISRLSLGNSEPNAENEIDSLIAQSPLPSLWLAKAIVLLNKNNQEEALSSLDVALEIDSDYYLAKSLKADISTSKGDIESAIDLYTSVLEIAPWRTTDLLKRGVSYIRIGDLDTAEHDINRLLKLYPDGISVNYAKGVIDYQRDNLEASIQSFKVAEAGGGEFSGALLYLAAANTSIGNLAQSEDYAQRYFSSNPSDKNGRMMLARIYLNDERYEDVVSLLESREAEFSESPEYSKVFASALLSIDRNRGVDYIKAIPSSLKDTDLHLILASALYHEKRYAESLVSIEDALSLDPDNLKVRYLKVANFVSMQNIDKALQESKLVVSRYPSESTRLMLSEVYYLSGDKKRGLSELEGVAESYPGSEMANLKMADIARRSNDLGAAEDHYNTILKFDPSNKAALLEMHSLQLAKKEYDLAEASLTLALDANPDDIGIKNILANFYVSRGLFDKARVTYSTDLESVYRDPTAYGLYIRTLIEESKFDDAKFHLARYEHLMPNSPIPSYMSAKISASLADPEKVYEHLKKSLDKNPEFYPSMVAMAKYYVSQGEVAQLRGITERIHKLAPDISDTKFLLAKVSEMAGDYQRAADLAKDAYLFDLSDSSISYWSLLCLKSESLKCLKEADSSYSPKSDRSAVILEHMAGYYLHMNDTDSAIARYKEIVAEDSENVNSLNNLGWLLASIDSKAATGYSEKAYELDPESAQVVDTYAMSLAAFGNARKAAIIIREAVALDPKDETLLYHKAYIDSEAGSTAEALSALKELLNSEKDFPERANAESLLAKIERN